MNRAFLCLLPIALGACGGHVILGAGDGGASSGNGGGNPPGASDDAGAGQPPPGTPFPVCPGTPPKTGWSCPTPNQGCAYVDVQAGTCESWTCNKSYEWQSSTPAGC